MPLLNGLSLDVDRSGALIGSNRQRTVRSLKHFNGRPYALHHNIAHPDSRVVNTDYNLHHLVAEHGQQSISLREDILLEGKHKVGSAGSRALIGSNAEALRHSALDVRVVGGNGAALPTVGVPFERG